MENLQDTIWTVTLKDPESFLSASDRSIEHAQKVLNTGFVTPTYINFEIICPQCGSKNCLRKNFSVMYMGFCMDCGFHGRLTLPTREEAEKQIKTTVENWDTFVSRIKIFSDTDQRRLRRAYQFAKSAHRNQLRAGDDPERYFEHCRAVFLILFDEVHLDSVTILVTALLHDVLEDTALFANPKTQSHKEWIWDAYLGLEDNFGEPVARAVLNLTKEDDFNQTLFNIRSAPPYVALVKMADRLHNLRTLNNCSMDKQFRKVAETRVHYFPLFERVVKPTYPTAYAHLKAEMDAAIKNLRLLREE